MKKFIVAAAVLLAACQPEAMSEMSEKRLSTSEDFATITGKTLKFGDSDFVVINANGTLSGEFAGVETLGTWEVRDGYWCRELSAGPRGPSPEDCQLFVRSGKTLNITRERGEGASFVYIIS